MAKAITTTVAGNVLGISVNGKGLTTVQLSFTIKDNATGKKHSMRAGLTDYTPQVFTSMAGLLTAAYFAGKPVTATYELTGKVKMVTQISVGY